MPRSTKAANIPIHTMSGEGLSGFMLERIFETDEVPDKDTTLLQAHRDDHYVFLLQEKGYCSFMVDFTGIELRGPSLFFILPGQVHHYFEIKSTEGWFMAVDASLINDAFRAVFEEPMFNKQVLPLTNTEAFTNCLTLLHAQDRAQPAAVYQQQVTHSLINAFMGMVASAFAGTASTPGQVSRTISITRQFKALVTEKVVSLKNPADYANLLNLSLTYLNEVVKATTGFTVSYWIQQEVLLEAKRLLYYTDLTIKEIACRTGYEDHAYFCRLFKKGVGCTPLSFRGRYRE